VANAVLALTWPLSADVFNRPARAEDAVPDVTCPSCAEPDRLTGTSSSDGIEITCHACGHRWLRGERRCRACGAAEAVVARQRMTTHPRGNQLAVLGIREVLLCPECDREVVAGLGTDRMAPEGYVPRFSRGAPDDQPTTSPRSAHEPSSSPTRVVARAPSAASSAEQANAYPVRPGALPVPSPTVRTAVASYLQTTSDPSAAAAMLLLGPSLGIATRLDRLDASRAGRELTAALDRSCGEGPGQRRLALVYAIRDALAAWVSRGWLPHETVQAIEFR
jgi:hypothetical protein